MSTYVTKNEYNVAVYYADEFRKYMPAINVKCRNYPRMDDLYPDLDYDDQNKVGESAFDYSIDCFWEAAERIAKEVFGSSVTIYSCGRSGGWCCVDGLPEPVEEWKKVTYRKWGEFQDKIDELFREVKSEEFVRQYVDELLERWNRV